MVDDAGFLDSLTRQLRCQETPSFPRDSVLELMPDKRSSRYQPSQKCNHNAVRHVCRLAAAIIAAVMVAGLIWSIGPFGSDSSFAMEQVLNAVEQSHSVSYTFTTYGWGGKPWPDPFIRKIRLLMPGRSRMDVEGEVQIINTQQGRITQILEREKKVVIRALYPSSSGVVSPVDEILQQLRKPADGAEKRSSRLDQDGRSIVEFRRTVWGDAWKVVVDANTKLPIRMEISRGIRNGKEIREVISDFVFDGPMEEALFESVVPRGFSVEERVTDRANKSYPAADAETLIVAPGQLGPVRSGMTTAEIIQALGKPDWIETREFSVSPVPNPGAGGGEKSAMETLDYDSRGFQLTLVPGERLAISCFGQLSRGSLVRDFVGRTPEGIKLGATREEVIEAYGKPELEREDFIEYLDLGWQFQFRQNKLCEFATRAPIPKRRADGVQTRVLKDGSILETAPGVDIDSMIDSDGNLQKSQEQRENRVR